MNKDDYKTNNQRKANEEKMNGELKKVLVGMKTVDVLAQFRAAKIPVAQVNLVPDVLKDDYLNKKLLAIKDPKSGFEVSLAPPPVAAKDVSLSFPPRFGEHNEEISCKLGYDVGELRENGVI